MELLVLVPVLGLLGIYIAYKEWLNVAYRQWQAELDLFKKRLAAYEQLKSAVGDIRANGAVSSLDANRFAQAMADMRFLFDKDMEGFVSGIYDDLLKKHALDALIEKVAGEERALAEKALIEKALRKSQELSSRITDGIYRDMPQHMEKFVPRESALPRGGASAKA